MSKIAILGYGTVGGGVASVLRMNGAAIAEKLGRPIELTYILDRVMKDHSPDREKWVTDFSLIEKDPSVEVVVETIGGCGAALEFTRRCLQAGKHVVTANKQLVAEHGRELLQIAAEHKVQYLFEASVGGGIPILHPLIRCLAANRVQQIYGIMNGTTNYILTRMVSAGATFAQALQEAQEKGYAEADPTADVEGHDACRKTCILANLAYGKEVRPDQVPTRGISQVELKDVLLLEKAGYRMKLLGRAIRREDGCVTAYVSPHVIADTHPIARVDDVFNAIVVEGNATGDVLFFGRGAGALPTASAVVSDIINIFEESKPPRAIRWDEPAEIAPVNQLPLRRYLRCAASEETLRAALGELLVLQSGEETAALTEALTQEEWEKRSKDLAILADWPVL